MSAKATAPRVAATLMGLAILRPPSARNDGHSAEAECRRRRNGEETSEKQGHSDHSGLAGKREGLRPEQGQQSIASTIDEQLSKLASGDPGRENEKIRLARDPEYRDGEYGGDRGRQPYSRHARWTRLGHP